MTIAHGMHEPTDLKRCACTAVNGMHCLSYISDVVQGYVPANVDRDTVKKLVQQQIEACKPIRAPWYREGPRNPSAYRARGNRAPPSQQHTVYADNKKVCPCLLCKLLLCISLHPCMCSISSMHVGGEGCPVFS